MKHIPKFIRQLAFTAIEAEIASIWPKGQPELDDLQAKLFAAIQHALRL